MYRVHRWGWLIILSFLFCIGSYAAVQTRALKAGGSTDYTAGQVITAAEVNADFNTLYTLQDGNIDSTNLSPTAGITSGQILDGTIVNADINAAAGIVFTKLDQTVPAALDADVVDDYSTNDAEQITETTPGTTDALTNATNLEEEIAMLRYKIHELTVGISASAVAAAAATATDTSWADGPIRRSNMLQNGGFDIWNSTTPTVGDGWSATASAADTVQSEALIEVEEQGDGNGINVIAGAADTNEGVQQTLDGLKAATRYLAIVWVRPDDHTCSLGTSGADTNELTVVSGDGTGTWEVLSGTFETDAVPTDVIIQLLAVDNSSDCVFDNAGVYEINADPMPPYQPLVAFDSSSTDDDVTIANTWENVDGLDDLAVTPPTSGWVIDVVGVVAGEKDANGGAESCMNGRLSEDCGGGAVVVAQGSACATVITNSNGDFSIALNYVNTSPTAGEECTYAVEFTGGTTDIKANGESTISSLRVMAIPPR